MEKLDATITEQLALLGNHRLFRRMSIEEKKAFLEIGKKEYYCAGKYIIVEDDIGESFYLMLKGKVKILKNVPLSEPEKAECIGILETGDTFGEMAILNQEPSTASVFALTDCEVLSFNTLNLESMLSSLPSTYIKLLKNMIYTISCKLGVMGTRFALTLFSDKNDN